MKRNIKVFLEDAQNPVGTLFFTADRGRESASFAYAPAWLQGPGAFAIDPSLPLVAQPQFHKKGNFEHASVFFGCISDSEPDGWGVRVINRMHAKLRNEARENGQPFSDEPLTSLDHLLYVDDACRIGALRFQDEKAKFVRSAPSDGRTAPPLMDINTLLNASRAVEDGTDTAADLRYLMGKGTSLGGMRPKCSVVDDDGGLLIGKFPSAKDTTAVTKAEALALRMAGLAGIRAAGARVLMVDGSPVTLVRRFDRIGEKRRMFVSARTLLGVEDGEEHAYTEIMDALVKYGRYPDRDGLEIWSRIAFSVLIRNVDDHLNNHGFLHIEKGQWELSPAFDINPSPEKSPVLKTWISENTGPEAKIEHVIEVASYFRVSTSRAKERLSEILQVVDGWRKIAATPDIGMTAADMEPFETAFRHSEVDTARKHCSTPSTLPTPKSARPKVQNVAPRSSKPKTRGDGKI